eukprot:3399000-Rhodomonas_salina.1
MVRHLWRFAPLESSPGQQLLLPQSLLPLSSSLQCSSTTNLRPAASLLLILVLQLQHCFPLKARGPPPCEIPFPHRNLRSLFPPRHSVPMTLFAPLASPGETGAQLVSV